MTGGTGFLGAHSVRAVRAAGHDVRVLVHPTDSPDVALVPLGVELVGDEVVVGDVCDPSAVDHLLDGCDALLHAAGIVGVDDSREQLMWDVNVQATAMVLAQAVAARLDPIVHVASYAALYPSPTGVIGPDTPTAPGRSAYGRTKSVADRIARGLQAGGAPVVITYPSSVVGPPAGTRRGVSADGWAPLLRFGVSVAFDGGMEMIDVRDVADVHAALFSAGPGLGPRRYVCGGEMVPFNDVVDALEGASGRRIRRIPISPRAMRALGHASDVASRMLRFPPVLSSEAAILLTRPHPTDDSVTLSELGLTWRPVRSALADSLFDA